MIVKQRDSAGISSVSEFVELVLDLNRDGKPPVAFRGQSYYKWPTQPKIFRPDVGLYEFEKDAVRDIVAVHPQEFTGDVSMFDRLVRMQHFNLPTRLLDVTLNPLVALYFATDTYAEGNEQKDGKVQVIFIPEERQRYFDSDRVTCMANLANLTVSEKKGLVKALKLPADEFNDDDAVKRLLWFVRIEKPHFEPKIIQSDLKLPVFVKPKMSNRRIIAQSGAFILYGQRRSAEVSSTDAELKIQRITIAADSKSLIRKQLDRLGIHACTLFPEIDKASEYIVRKYAEI